MREIAGRLSKTLNMAIEAVVALLMVLLVLDVWLGVVDRYLFHWQLPWPETLARYLMIWAAMLAISCAIARREHIGLTLLIDRLPDAAKRGALIISDILALCLFAYLLWFGIDFAASGMQRQAMIFGATLMPAFAAIPVAAAISALQLSLVVIRDMGGQPLIAQTEEV